MEGISLDFHCFEALNNYLEAHLFCMFIFIRSSEQLRFFKLETVLTYAFNYHTLFNSLFATYGTLFGSTLELGHNFGDKGRYSRRVTNFSQWLSLEF